MNEILIQLYKYLWIHDVIAASQASIDSDSFTRKYFHTFILHNQFHVRTNLVTGRSLL